MDRRCRETTARCRPGPASATGRLGAHPQLVEQEHQLVGLLGDQRVLKRGGFLYLQVPFVIGYHPGPTDFWRFTKEGVREILARSGLECVEIRVAVGGGTGFYRILVEFAATLASRISARLYFPVKAGSAILCFPLKWLDRFLITGPQCDRIAGGYLAIARKQENA